VEEEEEAACEYTEWAAWSNCSSACGSGVRRRERLLAGGGAPCTYTTGTASCYGVAGCVQRRAKLGRASLIPGRHSQHDKQQGYEVRSNLRNFTAEAAEEELYCLEFTVATASVQCGEQPETLALARGAAVCALCTTRGVQHRPAPEGGLCRGGGQPGRASGWRLFLAPGCSGTWRRRAVAAAAACSCPALATFVFV
jgi:hypothetical protein